VKHDREVLSLALLGGALPLALAMALLWTGAFSAGSAWILTIVGAGTWLGVALGLRGRVVRPLRTISNMVAALREGDFSLRVRTASAHDPLGALLHQLNSLADDMRAQRLGALEATVLLRRVIEETDVAVFAFDDSQALRLVNRSGAQLLGQPEERLLGRSAAELGLAASLSLETPGVLDITFGARRGRWEVRPSTFRQGGRPHTLLVLSDVSRTLRNEERQAWQRLIRVLGHEINNSLAPIKSIAESLQGRFRGEPSLANRQEELSQGLRVIASRAESLSRLMGAYARLARLPPPRLEPVSVAEWIRRVVALETQREVTVRPGPDVTIQADGAQLDQVLINLVRNAIDATIDTDGTVEIGWLTRNGRLEVCVSDEGHGLADTANLFVPFYTTKPNGSGIGLVLSRQIAEAHGGGLTLTNRTPSGCEARLSLPI